MNLASQRLSIANKIFGEKVIRRILTFALFLLGLTRNDIAKQLDLSVNTIKSNIRTLHTGGIAAFEDRRQKTSAFLPVVPCESPPNQALLVTDNEQLTVKLGSSIEICIPLTNTLQIKTILLTLLNNQLIAIKEVATALNLTTAYTESLARGIKSLDVDQLIDKRHGQQQDYVFQPEIKAEIIRQYSLACITGQSVSGRAICPRNSSAHQQTWHAGHKEKSACLNCPIQKGTEQSTENNSP